MTGPVPLFGDRLDLGVAVAHNLGPVGSCDWGDCDGDPWGVRWCPEMGEYLTVCWPCASGPHGGREEAG